MDDQDEHRRRWIAQKQAAAHGELVGQVKAQLQASVGTSLQRLLELARQLATSEEFGEFYEAVDRLAELSRSFARATHSAKTFCDWSIPPVPEFTDHVINQYFVWPEFKRTFWLEGAVMCSLGMQRGGRYLELCCGSGFYSDMFYASIARELVAIDFDPRAIELARRDHARSNVRYEVVDIRNGLPDGPFDGVVWDGAIEHFSTAEIGVVMAELKRVLVPQGFLSGYTVTESSESLQHPDHEQQFKGMADLGALLKLSFENVLVFESLHPTIAPPRRNLFFYAGDGTLPFDADWPHAQRF